MKKRILSLLLVLAMCLALLPGAVLADGETVTVLTKEMLVAAETAPTEYISVNVVSGYTFYELEKGKYKLGEEIQLSEDDCLEIGKDATLDLNGHILHATVKNYGTLYGGTVDGMVRNNLYSYNDEDRDTGRITGGTFEGMVWNYGTISGGTFHGDVLNAKTSDEGTKGYTISGGTFYGKVYSSGIISGGVFYDYVNNESGGPITGGVFYGDVNNENGEPITGGVFYGKVKNNREIKGGTFIGGIDGTKPDSATEITIDFGDGSELKTAYILGSTVPSLGTPPAREGYTFDGWYLDADFKNPVKFDAQTSVTENMTLYAKWTREDNGAGVVIGGLFSGLLEGAANVLDETFVDVSRGAYYYNAVEWAANHGIAGGVDAKHFAPDDSCTRAQAVTMLYRAAGCPDVWGENPFVDVDASDYYYEAVLWAVANGITSGTDENHFSPDDACTRGQIVTFLHRAARCYVAHESFGFADVKTGSYCEDAINWAVENAITNGTSEGTFSPDSVCTRAQIVTFLYRNR